MINRLIRSSRRGAAYLMVLGTTLVVATLSLSGLLLARGRLAASASLRNAAEARAGALAGIELAGLWIAEDANWRVNRSVGAWATDLAVAQGTVSITVSEPIDGNLTNRPYDSLSVRSTGKSGTAVQAWEVTLNADPEPLPLLNYALHCRGQLRIGSGKTLTVRKAPADTDGVFRNDGALVGDVEATSVSGAGTVIGSVTLDSTTEQYPTDALDLYLAIGTQISPGDTIEQRVLSPGANPWGAANPDGVYIVRPSGDLRIRNSRIYGTLIVLCQPGMKVRFEDQVLIHPFRTDYPTLIIDGDAEFNFSRSQSLLEAVVLANLNPAGSPYHGWADADILDIYPSEIRGLVHVRGKLDFKNDALVRGAVICESRTGDSDVNIDAPVEIVYDESLRNLPPQGYAARVFMLPNPGTWKRVVE